MSDYLDVLYEKSSADGIFMAIGLIETDSAEGGQGKVSVARYKKQVANSSQIPESVLRYYL